jgi:hypothetical protein
MNLFGPEISLSIIWTPSGKREASLCFNAGNDDAGSVSATDLNWRAVLTWIVRELEVSVTQSNSGCAENCCTLSELFCADCTAERLR